MELVQYFYWMGTTTTTPEPANCCFFYVFHGGLWELAIGEVLHNVLDLLTFLCGDRMLLDLLFYIWWTLFLTIATTYTYIHCQFEPCSFNSNLRYIKLLQLPFIRFLKSRTEMENKSAVPRCTNTRFHLHKPLTKKSPAPSENFELCILLGFVFTVSSFWRWKCWLWFVFSELGWESMWVYWGCRCFQQKKTIQLND